MKTALQVWMLQLVDDVSLPLHLPATEHVLVLVFVPCPHVRLHVPHELHKPQVTVTVKTKLTFSSGSYTTWNTRQARSQPGALKVNRYSEQVSSEMLGSFLNSLVVVVFLTWKFETFTGCTLLCFKLCKRHEQYNGWLCWYLSPYTYLLYKMPLLPKVK